jgi:transposase
MLKLTDSTVKWLKNTADQLKGSSRRMFMAETVQQLGRGGASAVQEKLGWNRGTIRKGLNELENGPTEDRFSERGRKKSEVLLPNLLEDIKKIVEPECQTDPSFNSCRLYTRITAEEVRRRLLDTGCYEEDSLPCARTVSTKLNELGYHLKKVQKTKPQKK